MAAVPLVERASGLYCVVFIHFHSASNSISLSEALPTTAIDNVGVYTPKHYRQLRVEDLPKFPTWRLERDSNPRPSGRKASTLPMRHHANRISECRSINVQLQLQWRLHLQLHLQPQLQFYSYLFVRLVRCVSVRLHSTLLDLLWESLVLFAVRSPQGNRHQGLVRLLRFFIPFRRIVAAVPRPLQQFLTTETHSTTHNNYIWGSERQYTQKNRTTLGRNQTSIIKDLVSQRPVRADNNDEKQLYIGQPT